jgi:hypothetical protein
MLEDDFLPLKFSLFRAFSLFFKLLFAIAERLAETDKRAFYMHLVKLILIAFLKL